MEKKILSFVAFLLIFGPLSIVFNSTQGFAYQINLDYSETKTLDTVTPRGIYYQAIIFLDASPEILNKIQRVKYELEDTFFQNELEVRSPAQKFALEVQSLDHFSVVASVYFVDGKILTLNKYVMLRIHPPKMGSIHKIGFSHQVTEVENSKKDNPKSKKRYNVRLLMEGSGEELSKVDYVEYCFPPESPKRIIKVNTPPDFGYGLEMEDETILQAYIHFKDGTITELVRFVYFKYY